MKTMGVAANLTGGPGRAKWGNRACGVLLSALLVASGLTAPLAEGAFAAGASADAQTAVVSPAAGDLFTAEDVPALLEAGTYAEGRVLACVTDGYEHDAARARAASSVNQTDLYEFDDEVDAAAALEASSLASASSASSANAMGTTETEAETTADEIIGIFDQSDRVILIEDPTKTTEELLYELADAEGVLYAEPDYTTQLIDEELAAAETAETASADDAAVRATPDAATDSTEDSTQDDSVDPLLSQQWQLDSTEDSPGGTNVQEAWAKAGYTSSASVPEDEEVVVAVIDTGVDYTHPDLANVMWEDPAVSAELGWGPYGYDYCNDGADPQDDNSHGTHVAGIVAAELGNGEGGAGMAPNARIIALKAGDASGSVMVSNCVRAMEDVKRAAELGVNVVATNNSYGSDAFGLVYPFVLEDLYESCGIVSFLASGNWSVDVDLTPVSPNVTRNEGAVGVNAHGSDGQPADFTNYGTVMTDLSAPGSDILSTIPLSMGHLDTTDETALIGRETFEGEGTEAFLTFKVATGEGCAEATLERASESSGENSYLVLRADQPVEGQLLAVESEPVDLAAVAAAKGRTVEDIATLALEACCVDGEGTGAGRYISIEVSSADGGWLDVSGGSTHADSTWIQNACDLASVRDQIDWENFRIRLGRTLRASDTERGWLQLNFDNIALLTDGCATIPYDRYEGTSMACPAAAGAYALLCALYPDDSAGDRVNRLMGAVNRTDAMVANSVSEGMLNLDPDALDDPYPVVRSVAQTADDPTVLTVSGGFFGAEPGTVALEGFGELTVLSWGDDAITVALNADVNAIEARYLTVERSDGASSRFLTSLALTRSMELGADFESLPAPDLEALGVSVVPDAIHRPWTLCAIDGVIYAASDQIYIEREGEPATCVLAYDLRTRAWSVVEAIAQLPSIDGSLTAYAMCAYEGTLYFVDAPLQTIWSYEPATDALVQVCDAVDLGGRELWLTIPSAITFDGRSFVFTGVEEANSETGAWAVAPAVWCIDLEDRDENGNPILTEIASLDQAVSYASPALVDGRTVFVGGGVGGDAYTLARFNTEVHWVERTADGFEQGAFASLPEVAEPQSGDVAVGAVPAGSTFALADGTAYTTVGNALVATNVISADETADTYVLDPGEGEGATWRALNARLGTVKQANSGGVVADGAFYVLSFDQTASDSAASISFKRLVFEPQSAGEPADPDVPADPEGPAASDDPTAETPGEPADQPNAETTPGSTPAQGTQTGGQPANATQGTGAVRLAKTGDQGFPAVVCLAGALGSLAIAACAVRRLKG